MGLFKIVTFKEARAYFSEFFSNFPKFWYQKKVHIFLITHANFYSWSMLHLKDIGGNGTNIMVNIIKLSQLRYRRLHEDKIALYTQMIQPI